jgi:hypothetical protein
MTTTEIYRIAYPFATVEDFKRFNSGKRCRAKCGVCGKTWSETGTASVGLIVKTDGEQVFSCSPCVKKMEDGSTGED